MNTQYDEYIPVPNTMSLAIGRNYKMIAIKRTGVAVFRITFKTLLYAFILTVANVII